jgi:hypothetical protein
VFAAKWLLTNPKEGSRMRRELEQRPVDTKVLRDNFRAGLERKMNKLMSKGYVPMGGVSTHMNTHTKPILGIDAQEYTQTMVKYENIEVWIKETEDERTAYADEHLSQSLGTKLEGLKKGIAKDSKVIKQLEDLLNTPGEDSLAKKSFVQKLKDSINSSMRENRKSRLQAARSSLASHESLLNQVSKEIAAVNNRLDRFYRANPSVTKGILLKSR